MASAVLRVSFEDGRHLDLDGEGPMSVGRAPDAELRSDDLRVSRHHGRIERRGTEWWFVDQSTTGTFDPLGQPLSEVCLRDSTSIRLGATQGPLLTVSSGPLSSDRVVIGRGTECDMVLASVAVSRRHAEVVRVPGGWQINDLESANGTFVNGERVLSSLLSESDRVTIGTETFAFDSGALVRAIEPSTTSVSIRGVRVTLPDGTVIVDDVSFESGSATMTAILGPTGAGKSSLLKALTGNWIPSSGAVVVAGRDLYENFEELRLRIGYVPQDDIVHPQLTVHQALRFGADLRLPDDTSAADIEAVITRTCAELGLTDHMHKQVRKLSGGQRKRVSVALELLTEPDLMFLDEPTSGLDPGYEASIMALLRGLADAGRTILVVTHTTSSLDLCDQVVYLGTGGWVGYAGPPEGALPALGVDNHPAAFRRLESPNPAPRTHQQTPETSSKSEVTSIYPTGVRQQVETLVRRIIAVLWSDRRGLLVLAGSAAVPAGLLAALVGGGALSLDRSGPPSSAARTLVSGLIITAGVIGAANGLREIVKELPIYHRERAAGLRRGAYLSSKVLGLGAVTVTQSVILVLIATSFAAPTAGNLLPGRVELILDASTTGLVSLLFGLFISAFVTSSEKALALIPVVFIVFWLFSGTVPDLAQRPVLNELGYAVPSNWGMAAGASTTDLLTAERCGEEATVQPDVATPKKVCDERWTHSGWQWIFDLIVLVALGGVAFLGADWALARKEALPSLRRDHIVGRSVRSIRTR